MTAPLGARRPREIEVEAKSGAEARMAAVHRVMGAIAGARSVDEVCRLLATEAAPALGAERAVVALLHDDGRIHLAASLGYDEQALANNGRFQVDESTPMGLAIATETLVLVETQEEYESAFPKLARSRQLAGTAFATVPLIVDRKVLGAAHFGFARHQPIETVERALVVAFGNLAAQAIARSEAYERYKFVVENAPVHIVTIDRNGRVLSVNKRVREGRVEDPLGMIIYDAPGLTDRETIRERIETVMRTGVPTEYEACVHFSEQDERWFHVRVAPLHDGAVLLTSDITRRKRDEAEIALVRAQLIQGEKLAALGSLVSGVAHELRTPLTFLANNAFLAQQRLERAADRGLSAREARDESAPFFAEITNGVDRINQLVEDLRRFTKARQDRAFATSSLHVIVTDAAELFRATNRTKQVIETSLSPTPGVRANKGAIQQLVINLLQNAADATPAGGPIRIVTREDGAGGAGGAVLEVIDHGTGMSPAVVDRMYDPLFTTKAEGTGLGLSIVRRIVDEHHARIECESELGRGTTFRVIFPPRGRRLIRRSPFGASANASHAARARWMIADAARRNFAPSGMPAQNERRAARGGCLPSNELRSQAL